MGGAEAEPELADPRHVQADWSVETGNESADGGSDEFVDVKPSVLEALQNSDVRHSPHGPGAKNDGQGKSGSTTRSVQV